MKLAKILLTVIMFCGISAFAYSYFNKAEDVCATCTGSGNCNACKNCKYCKHCNADKGTCGVCK